MSSEKRPWYKWYPKDFVADEKVKSLSPISELVYRRLLDTMWQSSACVLLNDCFRLANVAGSGLLPEEFQKAWEEIQTPGYELFKTTEDGRFIYSSRMNAQIKEIEIKAESGRVGGKKSGEARRKQTRSKREAKANDTDTDTDIIPPISPKQKPKPFTPPSVDEVKKYFIENGYSEKAAISAFNYYQDGNPPWTDSQGNSVRSWKQKMRVVWFREENKEQVKKLNTGYDPKTCKAI